MHNMYIHIDYLHVLFKCYLNENMELQNYQAFDNSAARSRTFERL